MATGTTPKFSILNMDDRETVQSLIQSITLNIQRIAQNGKNINKSIIKSSKFNNNNFNLKLTKLRI
jgi:hypothetical protein